MRKVEIASGENKTLFNSLLSESFTERVARKFLGIENWREYMEGIIEDGDSEGLFVIFENENPVGYVIATPNEEHFIYLSAIYITPSHRGRGLCGFALERVLEILNASHVHAYVHEGNLPMQRVLRKMGGKSDGMWLDFKV